MTEVNPKNRPNCEEILKEKQLWALSENEFEIENKLRAFLESQEEKENNFLYFILESHLVEINDKLIKEYQLIDKNSDSFDDKISNTENAMNSDSESDPNSGMEIDVNSDSESHPYNECEKLIIESLNRFGHRQTFVQKTISRLYNYMKTIGEPTIDLIDLIVDLMRKHLKIIKIQEVATDCLYGLLRNKWEDRRDLKKLEKVIDITLTVMELFPIHRQLQSNALTLMNINIRLIPFDIPFDRSKCIELALVSINNFDNSEMNFMALDLCLLLSSTEKSNFDLKLVHLKSLLDLIRSHVQIPSDYENILSFSLSTISNLTDSKPKTCESFIKNGGLELYLIVLKVRL
jgi:hypothetical protein